MDVTRVPDPVLERLRHEADRASAEVGDLLGAILVDRVVVGHRQRVREAEVDLLLSWPRLAFGRLHAHARRLHPVADRAQERLVVGAGEDVVVEDVRHRRREARVAVRVRLGVGLLEEIELELGAHHRRQAELRGPLHLRPQHLTRRGLDGRAVVPADVAEHERRGVEPRDPAQRGHVGRDREVAVALFPARDLVPGDRVHLHLEREQVVAALDGVLGLHLLHEELGVEPLAEQASLHVGERDHDRVDLAGGDEILELGVGQHRGDPIPRGSIRQGEDTR